MNAQRSIMRLWFELHLPLLVIGVLWAPATYILLPLLVVIDAILLYRTIFYR
ncbi:hypothetical protein VSX61_08835 [Brenneria populi subsp. brevivirga]|uniref:hypothetical protein n=1 Tax=Brenneria populi TaxID=1505588 RepID=UPI002E192535|nr:hypothetical protein [Brenneria populi subsp. brevivirga]